MSYTQLQEQFGITALIGAKATAALPTLLLHHQCKRQYSEKSKYHLRIILKVVLTLWIP